MRGFKSRSEIQWGAGLARWALAALMLGALAPDLATESGSLSTYYPVPSGVYSRLITTGSATLARDAGQVGIGTTAPAAALDVAGTIRFAAARGELTRLNGNPAFGSNGAYPILLEVNGAEGARVSPAGNVGVGTRSPATKIEINGDFSFTTPGSGYAKICRDLPYSGGNPDPCPAGSTAVMVAGLDPGPPAQKARWYAHVYTDTTLKDTVTFGYSCGGALCGFPETGTMRCCQIAP